MSRYEHNKDSYFHNFGLIKMLSRNIVISKNFVCDGDLYVLRSFCQSVTAAKFRKLKNAPQPWMGGGGVSMFLFCTKLL